MKPENLAKSNFLMELLRPSENLGRTLAFLLILLPHQSIAEIYEVSTTAELRGVLASAALAGGDNIIRLDAGVYSTQSDGQGVFEYVSAVTGSLTIEGNADGATSLNGAGQDPVFVTILEDSISLSLILSDLTIENARSSKYVGGAGISIDAQTKVVSMSRMKFRSNSALFSCGGAVNVDGLQSKLTITDSEFTGNEANTGGAICANSLIIKNSIVRNNTAVGNGGALSISGYGDVVIMGSIFDGNSATVGGVWRKFCVGRTVVKGNIFSNNFASQQNGIGEVCGEFTQNQMINNSAASLGVGRTRDNAGFGDGGIFTSNIMINNTSSFRDDVFGGSAFATYVVTSNNIFSSTDVALSKTAKLANNIFLDNERDLFPLEGDDFYRISNNYINIAAISSDFNIVGSENYFSGFTLGFTNINERDFTLTSTSDLIDAGTTDTNLAYITNYDYSGTTARVIGVSIDIGPYEYVAISPDSDGDGVDDSNDAFPLDASESVDTDSDGTGNNADADDDGDGVADGQDAFPLDATETLDTDNDGTGNNADTDDDNDGFSDEQEELDGTNPKSRFSCKSGCFSFDVDENLEAQPLTDGLLVIRHLFGFSGDSLISGAVSGDASRDSSDAIASYLTDADSQLDIDGDGESKPLTDGLLLIRYLFGFSGDSLISGAIGTGATRDTAETVEAYIKERVPAE
jgi:hypothetical protein